MSEHEEWPGAAPPTEIKFDLIKSQQFRVLYVEGAVGSITPKGLITLAVYNERAPIPKQIVHEVTPEGKLGNEMVDRRDQRDALVREVEAELVMTIETARDLISWLTTRVTEAESLAKLREEPKK